MDAVQAVEVNSIMLATMAGAMVVLAGALYAAVYAIGKLSASRFLIQLSYLFYGVLLVSVLVLARTLNFTGIWNGVTAVMLVGYLAAPQAIWKLCVGTHVHEVPQRADNSDSSNNAATRADNSSGSGV